jgi:hypothetical protein
MGGGGSGGWARSWLPGLFAHLVPQPRAAFCTPAAPVLLTLLLPLLLLNPVAVAAAGAPVPQATIVNFAVKEKGLEAQLLGTVVNLEEPRLEERKSDLVVTVASGKRKLVELEDRILQARARAHVCVRVCDCKCARELRWWGRSTGGLHGRCGHSLVCLCFCVGLLFFFLGGGCCIALRVACAAAEHGEGLPVGRRKPGGHAPEIQVHRRGGHRVSEDCRGGAVPTHAPLAGNACAIPASGRPHPPPSCAPRAWGGVML